MMYEIVFATGVVLGVLAYRKMAAWSGGYMAREKATQCDASQPAPRDDELEAELQDARDLLSEKDVELLELRDAVFMLQQILQKKESEDGKAGQGAEVDPLRRQVAKLTAELDDAKQRLQETQQCLLSKVDTIKKLENQQQQQCQDVQVAIAAPSPLKTVELPEVDLSMAAASMATGRSQEKGERPTRRDSFLAASSTQSTPKHTPSESPNESLGSCSTDDSRADVINSAEEKIARLRSKLIRRHHHHAAPPAAYCMS